MRLNDFLPVAGLMQDVGNCLLRWRHEPEQRRILSPTDFKTQADARAHEMLVAGLRDLTPELPVLSEEEAWEGERPEIYWLIDPIDGTASWFGGFSGFATQAALIQHGSPLYGIVHAPALEMTWEGAAMDDISGAWRNGVRLPQVAPSNRLILCDNYPEPQNAAKTLSERLPITGYVESGSLGIKCCLVADGTADLFVKDVMVRDWDIAPAAQVLDAVGGVLCMPNGEGYTFTGPMEKSAGVLVARDVELARVAVNALSREGQ